MDQGRRKVAQLPVHSIRLFSVSRMHWCQRFCWFLRRQIRNDGENAMIQGVVDALNIRCSTVKGCRESRCSALY